ncbi:MAG: hypothetical protein Q8M07_29260, partial [Prosthecobacter sp.]|nr:hypothetical protein [Prosthecobacter sp.]
MSPPAGAPAGSHNSCWCLPGIYTIYSAGNDCHAATSAGAVVLQVFFIVIHLLGLGAVSYKLHRLRASHPSFFAFPRLLTYIWLVYFAAMLANLVALMAQLSGSALDVFTQVCSTLASTAVIGPMLYATWFSLFSAQMVMQLRNAARRNTLAVVYGLIVVCAVGIFVTSTLFAVYGGDLLKGLLYCFFGVASGFISVTLIGAPTAVLMRYYDQPPALILKLKWAWIIHFVLGLSSLLTMSETLFVAIWRLNGLFRANIFDSYRESRIILDLNFFYLSGWMICFCAVVLATINHTRRDGDGSHSTTTSSS